MNCENQDLTGWTQDIIHYDEAGWYYERPDGFYGNFRTKEDARCDAIAFAAKLGDYT